MLFTRPLLDALTATAPTRQRPCRDLGPSVGARLCGVCAQTGKQPREPHLFSDSQSALGGSLHPVALVCRHHCCLSSPHTAALWPGGAFALAREHVPPARRSRWLGRVTPVGRLRPGHGTNCFRDSGPLSLTAFLTATPSFLATLCPNISTKARPGIAPILSRCWERCQFLPVWVKSLDSSPNRSLQPLELRAERPWALPPEWPACRLRLQVAAPSSEHPFWKTPSRPLFWFWSCLSEWSARGLHASLPHPFPASPLISLPPPQPPRLSSALRVPSPGRCLLPSSPRKSRWVTIPLSC